MKIVVKANEITQALDRRIILRKPGETSAQSVPAQFTQSLDRRIILRKPGETNRQPVQSAKPPPPAPEKVLQVMHFACEVTEWARAQHRAGKRISFVPTMGYLHAGHLSLVEEAKKNADVVCVSIFVNPTQFGPEEDFEQYPRNEEGDLQLCRDAGVDVVFLPRPDSMYASDASVYVFENKLQNGLCGARRPGHFRGVCTIVAKLFNIVQPDVAVFGQKDYQQVAIIRRMVRDLDFPVDIITAPTHREPDGLAMSSRNVYLSPEERQAALGINRALMSLGTIGAGRPEAEPLIEQMRSIITQHGLVEDYLTIVDADTLKPVSMVQRGNVALIAVFCGKTRLIDNRIL
jgi:pantoate--beta-alanine ligase